MPDPRPLPQYPASEIPWLFWLGTAAWECRRCGASGRLDDEAPSGQFVRMIVELRRAHAACGRRGGAKEG